MARSAGSCMTSRLPPMVTVWSSSHTKRCRRRSGAARRLPNCLTTPRGSPFNSPPFTHSSPAVLPRLPFDVGTTRRPEAQQVRLPVARRGQLASFVLKINEHALAWTDDERGRFRNEYFDPVKIPTVAHIPRAVKSIPIPRGIVDEVIDVLKRKIAVRVYEPSDAFVSVKVSSALRRRTAVEREDRHRERHEAPRDGQGTASPRRHALRRPSRSTSSQSSSTGRGRLVTVEREGHHRERHEAPRDGIHGKGVTLGKGCHLLYARPEGDGMLMSLQDAVSRVVCLLTGDSVFMLFFCRED